jgi:hypothetical protein
VWGVGGRGWGGGLGTAGEFGSCISAVTAE